ncbi:sodium/potassium/calcium exchanger 3-like [Lytechinus variegatus]|uniref:sodium/potassium/calcium exchanger 3-like n=1 Tax=Lytechinus variegatus TaxID=7654 RepID=UPI001BB2CB5E|nr:sodium/potassium/calcium exchanger 3-like [Lytechinus variegatus]
MVMNRTDAISSPTIYGRIERWRAFLKRRRKLKRDSCSYLAATCALLLPILVFISLFNNHIFIPTRYDEDVIKRSLRSDTEDRGYDGSSIHDDQPYHNPDDKINCTERSIINFPLHLFNREQRRHGAVIIHVIVMAYMFASLGIVCEEYFMPALEVICEVLNLSEDVAGATFMAIGGSAPELFSSLIAVFITHDDIGVGTIVGSAVFNILCVIGLCGLLAGQVIYLTCWPLLRDCSCYIVSIIALVFVVKDGQVSWKDSLILLALYMSYCILMYFNPCIEHKVSLITPGCCTPKHIKTSDEDREPLAREEPVKNGRVRTGGGEVQESTHLLVGSDEERSPIRQQMNGHVTTNFQDPFDGEVGIDTTNIGKNNNDKGVQVSPQGDLEQNESRDKESDDDGDDNGEPDSPFKLPRKGCSRYAHMLALPIIAVFALTIPDCRKKRWQRFYVLTFIIALFWIGVLTYVLVWMVTVLGDTIGIPDTVMGLTLLAAGASTPDTMLSIIAARGGYGDMAISHSIGSNLFDILIGLGLPWFIQTVIIDHRSTVTVYSGAISYISMLLLLTVVIAVVLINVCRYRLGKPLGVLFIIFFVIFIIVSIMFELNLIIPGLTLPTCQ